MKTSWATKIRRGLLFAALLGAGTAMVGCADEYGAYHASPGGYYASYSAPYPYAGYGYGYGYPYRGYGPYYGGGYYGYGGPYYGGASVVVSNSHGYAYRDRYGRGYRTQNVNRNRVQTVKRTTRTRSTQARSYQNDDERRYYQRP
ncbi:MAG TPA: hypothetical protein VGM62_04415 [Chthoniobacterales bacterium]|jgi:hypothetical protein